MMLVVAASEQDWAQYRHYRNTLSGLLAKYPLRDAMFAELISAAADHAEEAQRLEEARWARAVSSNATPQ